MVAALLVPWKILTFSVAAFGITIVAPYTHDPYWDYPVALIMSFLTFTTAPWSLAVLYRGTCPRSPVRWGAAS